MLGVWDRSSFRKAVRDDLADRDATPHGTGEAALPTGLLPSVLHDTPCGLIWTVKAGIAKLLLDRLYRLVLAGPGGHANPFWEVFLDIILNLSGQVICHSVHGNTPR